MDSKYSIGIDSILRSLNTSGQCATTSLGNIFLRNLTTPDNGVTNYTVTINKDGNLGVNTLTPTEKLDVVGNVKTSGFVQFGSLTTAERNALSAVNGMVIYNSDDNKFQGYENGGWANLI